MLKPSIVSITPAVQVQSQDQNVFAPVVGRLVGMEGNQPLIDAGQGPTPARLLARVDIQALQQPDLSACEVLLVFEQGDPARPIIIDMLLPVSAELVSIELNAQDQDLVVDGKRIVFEAAQEIVLKCGEGSITLSKDGKIVVKGSQLISRSTGVNKIKGGSVQIN